MRAVLFDMDGVLVLTADAHYRSWKAAAAADGIDLSYEFFASTFGRTNTDTVRLIWNRDVPPERAAVIAAAKEAAFRDDIRANIPLAPGAVELLEDLASAGFAMAIGSSAPRENLDLIVDAADIRRFFAGMVDGSMVRRGKPDPEVFLLAARACAVDPRRCVVIEDAPAGVQAARAAGMRSVALCTTHDAGHMRESGADLVLPALRDVTRESLSTLVRG